MLEAERQKQLKRRKCYAYIAAFIVFEVIIIMAFSLTVMRIKTPRVKVRSVLIENLRYETNETTGLSFSMTLTAQVTVKNTNFGHFRYDESSVNGTYGGAVVGEGVILKGRASARKTKKVNVSMEVSSQHWQAVNASAASPYLVDSGRLYTDMNSGKLTLTGVVARVRGKVTLMKMIKKTKTASMNCTMSILLTNSTVEDLTCH